MKQQTVVPLIGSERARTLAEAASRVSDSESWKLFAQSMTAAHAWARMQKDFYALRRELLHAEIEALCKIAGLDSQKGIPKDVRDAAAYFAGLSTAEITRLVDESLFGISRAVGIAKRQLAVAGRRERGEELARWSWADSYHAKEAAEDSLGDAIRQAVDLAAKCGNPTTIGEIARGALDRANMDIADAALYEGALYVCRQAIIDSSVEWTRGTGLPRLLTVQLADGDMIRVPVETATVRHLRNMLAYRKEHLRGYIEAVERLQSLVDSLTDVDDDEQLHDAMAGRQVYARDESEVA